MYIAGISHKTMFTHVFLSAFLSCTAKNFLGGDSLLEIIACNGHTKRSPQVTICGSG